MKQYRNKTRILLLVPMLMILANCASLNVSSMVPDKPESKGTVLPNTLSITDVTGGNDVESENGIIYVSNEKFKEALTTSMKQSKIFPDVLNANGDMALSARIKEQYLESSNRRRASVFIAEYQLQDARTKQLLWTETYHSECPSQNPFHGLECAIKTNITAMTQQLKSHLAESMAAKEISD